MLTVTEAAKVLLAELIELRGFSGEIAIRLFNGDRGLAIVGDSERVGGVTFQHEGRTDTALYERMVNHVYGNSRRTGSLVKETGSKEAH